MKVKTTLVLMVLLISVNLSAQNRSSILDKRISISVQDEPLDEILKKLEIAGDLTLAYSAKILDAERIVTLNANNETVRFILSKLLGQSGLGFSAVRNKVIIYAEKMGLLTQTVRGQVLDPVSNQPIIGANVIILESDPLLGASTDLYGRFKISDVPVGRHNIQVTFMGYRTRTLSNLSVDSGKEVVLNISLEESVTALDEVVVIAEIDKSIPLNEMTLVSAKSFTVEETSRYAGSFNDPARMATTYAGVAGSSDDTENSIIIRGNSPRGLLWRLEGVEIPNPNHFASDGASSGAISMLNSNVLANSDFLTGAFPAEYGNAFSGVFDLKLRNGNNEKREYAIQAGLLGVDASFEGPIKRAASSNLPNPSYLINYRYSTITVLESLGLNLAGEGEKVPAFQDLGFKFQLPTRRLGTFSLYGLGGKSESSEVDDVFALGQNYPLEEIETYKMGLVGLNNIFSLSQSTFLETNISHATNKYFYLDNELKVAEDQSGAESFLSDSENYKNTALKFATTLNTKFNARHSTKFGVILTRFGYELNSVGFLDPGVQGYRSTENGNTGMTQAFVSHKVNLTDQLTMSGGFHYLRLNLAGQDSFEPRLGLKWHFNPNQSFSLGFGVHSRREETSLYLTELSDGDSFIQPNTDIELAKARHYVIGYDRNFGNDFHLKLEAYYQDLYDIPVANDPDSDYSALNQEDAYQRVEFINAGTGKNYGLELTFEKFLSKGYFFLMTGSLFESKYTALSGIEYNTRYSTKYNTNLVAGREFSLGRSDKKKTLNIGLETVFAGGARVREIDLQASIDNAQTVFVPNTPFARQLKDYARIDFQIALKTNKKKVTHELRLDVQNLTSRSNVVFERFNRQTQQIQATGFAGELIPVLSYKVIF